MNSSIPRKEQRQDRKDHERKEDNIEIESYIKQNGNCRANLTHVAEEFGSTKRKWRLQQANIRMQNNRCKTLFPLRKSQKQASSIDFENFIQTMEDGSMNVAKLILKKVIRQQSIV